MVKHKVKRGQKIRVKRKFFNAMQSLRRMSRKQQRLRASNASNEFIRDVSSIMKKLRTKPHLVTNKHKRLLKRYKKPLRRLVQSGSSVKSKRKVLLMRGGIIPFLIPIICAAIGAAGTVGAGAAGAAIMRS